MSRRLSGSCLCGAVRVNATPTDGRLTACHCDNCRRLTSAVNITFAVEPETLEVAGRVATYSALPWAERGFCATCGSPIWYRVVGDGPFAGLIKISAGLFDDAGGLDLEVEFFIDRKPCGYAFSGGQAQMTEAEVMELLNADRTEARDDIR